METFIARTNALLLARPDTRITTKITHRKVRKHDDLVDMEAAPVKVVIKATHPQSGITYKHKLYRVNELSRVLASLGPYKFDFDESSKRGAASIMADTEPLKQEEPAQEQKPETTTGHSKSKKSKSKK